HLIVLGLIHLVVISGIGPAMLSSNPVLSAAAIDEAFALRAGDVHGIIIRTPGDLSADMKAPRPVLIFVNDSKVIVNIPERFSYLPAAIGADPHRRGIAHRPGHHVKTVHGLFDNVIA